MNREERLKRRRERYQHRVHSTPLSPLREQTHCKRGHEFSSENTGRNSRGSRCCLACRRLGYNKRPRIKQIEDDLQRKYRLSLTDYEKMFLQQNGLCAICHLPETRQRNGKETRLVVDHSHVGDAKVRKLLCSRCNVLIGLAGDSPVILLAALSYLQQFGGVGV